jgi:hypothetical protein
MYQEFRIQDIVGSQGYGIVPCMSSLGRQEFSLKLEDPS